MEKFWKMSIQYVEIHFTKNTRTWASFKVPLYLTLSLQRTHFQLLMRVSHLILVTPGIQKREHDIKNLPKPNHAITKHHKRYLRRRHTAKNFPTAPQKARDPVLSPSPLQVQPVSPDTYHSLWLPCKKGHPQKWKSGTRSGPGRRAAGSKSASCTGNSLHGGSPRFSSA